MPVMFPALKEAEERLAATQKKLHEIFEQAGDTMDMSKVTCISGDSAAKVAEIRKLNAQLDEEGAKRDELLEVARAAERARAGAGGGEPGSEPGDDDPDDTPKGAGRPGHVRQRKGLGQLFVESDAFKRRIPGAPGPASMLQLDLKGIINGAKATFQTGDGWEPEVTRTGLVVPFATRPIQVTQLIPQNTTDQAAVQYMEETVFDNPAAETNEGEQYPEGRLKLEEKDSPVRDITVWLPVTDNQLADVNQARGYVENRLPFMVRQRLDGQILVGNGTAPNLTGLNNVSGILTQAKGSDPVPDAVYKAAVKVRVTGRAMVDAVIMHPNDWTGVRLLRTADGIYIWGSPSDPGPDRIWGYVVSQADGQTEDTGLVLDTSFTELAIRQTVEVQISNAHADFFIRGKQAVRAKLRVAFTVFRPAAVCEVTGI